MGFFPQIHLSKILHLGLSQNSMAPTILFILLSLFFIPANTHLQQQSNEDGFISLIISEKGLNFAKDLLIEQAISSLTPLELPLIQKSVKIPLIGSVHMALSNITIYQVNVSSSSVNLNDSGISIVASGATANLSMNWNYSYTSWVFVPIELSDKGKASIEVEGMEIGLTLGLENQGGTLKLALIQCGCFVNDIFIKLDGGASWFYQGLINAFEDQIRSAVENAINKKSREGILELDSLLQTLPKEIPVDEIASLNVTVENQPLLEDSSVGFEIDGLFTATDKVIVQNYYHKNSQPSVASAGPSKMLEISLDEAVFNSASVVYFNAESMRWIVKKVPDQSLLNTAGWRFIVPQLYRKYPNDDMQLNVSLSTPPVIRISSNKIDATIYSDMIIEVLDANEIVPVACISVMVSASGTAEISRNNLGGRVDLDDFTLALKWSKIGNIHMYLIQSVMWTFIKTVALPYANSHLRKGFPLPIIRGFTLQNADLLYVDSSIKICSDVAFTGSLPF